MVLRYVIPLVLQWMDLSPVVESVCGKHILRQWPGIASLNFLILLQSPYLAGQVIGAVSRDTRAARGARGAIPKLRSLRTFHISGRHTCTPPDR